MKEDAKTAMLSDCKAVLADNRRGDFTIPAEGLYPHQWLWDSAFIAIGLRHYDIERAKKEILSLLRGQWANGMIPHMIFASGDEHRRDRNIWRSWLSPYAPDGIATSGITQPPMLAEAVVKIGEMLPKDERREWYQTVYPALLGHHHWLFNERDPHNEGLVLLVHPYETGLDNTPPWINQLYMHHKPWWAGIIQFTHIDTLVNFVRRDTLHVAPGQRMSNIEALLYYDVIRRLRRKAYDIDSILNRSHFVVEDLVFNSIFIRANHHLETIAKAIGHEIPEEISVRIKKSEEALERLWDGYSSQYYSRNFITHKLIKEPSIATLMPLYAGCISQDRAGQLVRLLKDSQLFGTKFPIPSVPANSTWYKELGYWQGPTWINTNWLVADGLRRYGFKEEAKLIVDSSLELVANSGPYEYFSALNGAPAGAKNFSWTASLIIDMVNQK